ncbi:MAG TPA: hypothetical protein VD767_11845 [Thermomicrobiales bacterium]|nr:hypothetical protein [Thermomicrobiales bacterium]
MDQNRFDPITKLIGDRSLSRRRALANGGAVLAAGALAGVGRATQAQEATPTSLAGHPLTGAWLVLSSTAAPAIFGADGSAVLGFAATPRQVGAQGVEFGGPAFGIWTPTGERSGRFTVVQVLTDASGVYSGTVTIDAGQPVVSDDGQTFTDDRSGITVTVRDAASAVVAEFPPDGSLPPLTATRIGVGSPGFPNGTPEAGTPAS